MKTLDLIGAPFDLGASRRGCSMGPTALRIAGLVDRLAELGHPVVNHGDLAAKPVAGLTLPGRARDAAAVAGWARALEHAALESLSCGNVPVFLGGDHSISFGTVSGAARHAEQADRPLFVLWLDAHADYNTPATSPSGNMHGMPVACFTGLEGFENLLPANRPQVRPDHVFLFGARSIDADERHLLLAAGVNVLDMRALDEHGVAGLMRRIIDIVTRANGLLHVSLDADFLDPEVAPGVGTPVNGGVTWREAHLAMEMLADSGLVSSMDIVELNPFLDNRGMTAKALVDLTASLFGQRIYASVDAAAFVAATGGQEMREMLLSA